MAQMNAPQKHGEPDKEYHCHHDMEICLHHVMFQGVQPEASQPQAKQTEETKSILPAIQETSDISGPTIRVPFNVHVPRAYTQKD